MLVQMCLGPIIARRYRAALYVSSCVFPTLGFPCPTGVFLYDLMLYHFPQQFNRLVWSFRKSLLRASLPCVSAVFTISEASAEDIKARFRNIGAVHIVPCGAPARMAAPVTPERESAILEELNLKNRRFLVSPLGGGIHKNPDGLAAATQKLVEACYGDVDIIVVGDALQTLENVPHPPSLRALGFVSDEVLATLYANAKALVFPTLFEGFGMPVIEAQAAGLPVVCSDIEVLREVGGQGALFFDPHSPEAMAEAIITIIDSPDLQARLIERGKQNAARFSWRNAVEKFLAGCDSVMRQIGTEESVHTQI